MDEKEKLEKDMMVSWEESRAKWRMESEREKKMAEKAIVDKYGAAMGGNINNYRVVLGMTKEPWQRGILGSGGKRELCRSTHKCRLRDV